MLRRVSRRLGARPADSAQPGTRWARAGTAGQIAGSIDLTSDGRCGNTPLYAIELARPCTETFPRDRQKTEKKTGKSPELALPRTETSPRPWFRIQMVLYFSGFLGTPSCRNISAGPPENGEKRAKKSNKRGFWRPSFLNQTMGPKIREKGKPKKNTNRKHKNYTFRPFLRRG